MKRNIVIMIVCIPLLVLASLGITYPSFTHTSFNHPNVHFQPPFNIPPAAAHLTEADYIERIMDEMFGEVRPESEVILPDGSRVDIIEDVSDVAYEVDHSHKKFEAIGQALFYSAMTGKRPGIVLLMDGSEQSKKDYLRCRLVCNRHNIELKTYRKEPDPSPD